MEAWKTAPVIAGLHIIFDLPALIINVLITALVYRGIKESRNFSNLMVILKMIVVLMVILVGGYLVFSNGLTGNWEPINDSGVKAFMPNGFSGVMAAVSGVFFAYIGFDAVSVLAEESKNPQRDLPRGMILSLVICTIVYILLTMVLTGAVNYRNFEGVGDPLAFIFEKQNLNVAWMQLFVAVAAIVAMTSVLLVFQMGQPRIWMSMSRDGLLPPVFQKIHHKFKTPSFATIVTGIVVGVPILFTDKTFVHDFTSIATLFAFVLVCGGVLLIPRREKEAGKFHIPFINGQYIFPLMIVGSLAILYFFNNNYFQEIFSFSLTDAEAKAAVAGLEKATPSVIQHNLDIAISAKETLNVSTIIFWIICFGLSIITFIKKYSLIPLLGLGTCLYLLTGMTLINWQWFGSWLLVGLVLYLLYGYRKSKLAS